MRFIKRIPMAGILLVWPIIILIFYFHRWMEVDGGLPAWMKGFYTAGLGIVSQMQTGGIPVALPAFHEAVIRAGQAAVGASLVLAAAQALGWLLCGLMLWSPAHRMDRLLYRTAVGLGGIAYLSLALAVMNQYFIHRTSALVGLMAAGGLAYIFTLRGARIEKRDAPPDIDGYPSQKYRPSRSGDRVWQAVTATAAVIALIGALAPETESEAMWHHLWMPLQWLENGSLVYFMQEPATLYPQTWELIFGAGLSIGGFGAAKLLNFSAYLFTLILVYRMTERFMPAANPWLAVAIFATVPAVVWLGTTANVLSGVGMYVGLTVYALLHYLERRQRGWLAMAIVNLGLALASSHLAVVALFISIAVLGAVLWGLDGRRRSLLAAAALGSAAITFPLPWYFRSWLASNHPGITGIMLPSDGSGFLLPWNLAMPAEFYGDAFRPVFLLLLPMIFLLPRSSRSTVLILTFATLYTIWVTLLYPTQGYRALLPAVPLAAVLGAAAYQRWQELLPGGAGVKKVIHCAAALMLLSNLPPFAAQNQSTSLESGAETQAAAYQIPLGVVIGYETEEDYLMRKVPSYAAWQYAKTHLPPDSRVLTFNAKDYAYGRMEQFRSDTIVEMSAHWQETDREEKQALDRLRGLGVTHILRNKLPGGGTAQENPSIIMQEAFTDYYYRVLYEDDFYILYELKYIQQNESGG
jgi:hypothetical protein